MKKYLSVILAALLVLSLLAGCGATAPMEMENGSMGTADRAPVKGDGAVMESVSDSAAGASNPLPQTQKLIRTIYLDAETEDMSSLLSGVKARIAELGGYVEDEDIYNGSNYASRRYRHASLIIRIPADKLDAFIENVSSSANITSSQQTVEDVTLSYVATESRIKALETEQTRLLELLAQAQSMDDILQIESRLTNIRHELEQVTSQLRVLENQVTYGTVHLNISEVKEYTDVSEPETVWQRIGKGFTENLKALGDFFVELFVFIVTGLPILVPLAIVAFGVIWLLRKAAKKKSVKKEKKEN